MSMHYTTLSENCGGIDFRKETEPSTIAVGLDDENFASQVEIRNFLYIREYCFNFEWSFLSGYWVLHGDIVDIQKYQNAITAQIEVKLNKGLCKSQREYEGIDIVIPSP